MKKSLMSNIRHFVDSNVRQRIDRAANNNNDFFGEDLLVIERQFEDLRRFCVDAEKRISALLTSLSNVNTSQTLGAYTHNVQASLTNLSLGSSHQLNDSSTVNTPDEYPPKSRSTGLHDHHDCNHPQPFNNAIPTVTGEVSNPTISSGNHSMYGHSIDESTGLSNSDIRCHKKLPIVGFLKFLVKSRYKTKPDSLLATALFHCSQLQNQLTKLYLKYEQAIDLFCLKPIRYVLEVEAPNVIKLRKSFIKSHNDLESIKAKYNGANLKQQQLQTNHFTSTSYAMQQTNLQQANINKLDQLRKELDEAEARFQQARDNYATELYSFVCRESEFVNLLLLLYQHQAEYHQQVESTIQNSLPILSNILINTPRKVVFGTALEEHQRWTGRSVSLVIELCVHLLYSNALSEEGLFRIPGSLVKIKKLKSAINAWFVTLANQTELSDELEDGIRGHSSLFAIYDLFEEVLGYRQQLSNTLVGIAGTSISNRSARENEFTPSHTNASISGAIPSVVPSQDNLIVFDVHSIAGLLKLYLRELPEHLFTDNLYQKFLDATILAIDNKCFSPIQTLLKQIPKTNYDNLRHLIRFLHLLTNHSDSNKMTATNLAIAMAPSLIWARSLSSQNQSSVKDLTSNRNDSQPQTDGLQAINLQISNIGISASMHAMFIEYLIKSAETLFPGPIQFSIPDLNTSVTLINNAQLSSRRSRCVKSGSPTGLSTASSSSLSSSSAASSDIKSHVKKSGSIEVLTTEDITTSFDLSSGPAGRPNSIHMPQRSRDSQRQPPPPIPPAPAIRTLMRQSTESTARSTSRSKQPAPPIPNNSNSRHQLKQMSVRSLSSAKAFLFGQEPRAVVSCAKTSPSPMSETNHSGKTRPTVPPPIRPVELASQVSANPMTSTTEKFIRPESSDAKSLQSRSSSCNLGAEFEEVNTQDVDDDIDISLASVSPVASFDSLSGDVSSFDDESRSPEHSWTECDIGSNNGLDIDGTVADGHDKSTVAEASKEKNFLAGTSTPQNDSAPCPKERLKPPPRPMRSTSPKIAQSTPL